MLAANPLLVSLDVHGNALSALPGAWADTGSSLAALPLTYCDVSMNRILVRSWAPATSRCMIGQCYISSDSMP